MIFGYGKMSQLSENEISRLIVGLCLRIRKTLGPGLLESVYEKVLR